LPGKHVPHFKPGKEMRERVNEAFQVELQEEAQLQEEKEAL
jgi:integration host factor subunit beta